MSFLETVTFTDVLCRQARTTKQKDWLHEIEQTAKYDCNFHDFLSDILLASNLCFQIQRGSSPQVTDDWKQFSDLYLWVKLKHFSFLFTLCLQNLDTWVLYRLIKVKKTVSRHIQKSQSRLESYNRKIHPTDVRPMASIMFHWILSFSFAN